MNKFILLLTILFSSTIMLTAQSAKQQKKVSPSFGQGDQFLNVSMGFLNATSFTFQLFQANGSGDPSPSLNLDYEYGLTDQISIGAFTSYYRVKASTSLSLETVADQIEDIDFSDIGSAIGSIECLIDPSACSDENTTVQERINVFSFGAKLSYHKDLIPGLDTYASTYLGYSINRRKTITESALDLATDQLGLKTDVPRFIYFGSAGARYFINDKWAVFGEFGIGNVHLLKLGTSIRL